jgi:hypothetical protein
VIQESHAVGFYGLLTAKEKLTLGYQAGKFSPPDGPVDWAWKSVGHTRKRQDAKKNKSHIVCRYMTIGFLRNLTCRFNWQPKGPSGNCVGYDRFTAATQEMPVTIAPSDPPG